MMAPELENVTGKYYRDCKEGKPREDVFKRDWQKALWEASIKITKLSEEENKI